MGDHQMGDHQMGDQEDNARLVQAEVLLRDAGYVRHDDGTWSAPTRPSDSAPTRLIVRHTTL